MARIRSIKPDFWTDEKVVELSAFARLLFIGLWNFADDEGRMVYSEKKIKMQIFPSDNINISELFGEIRREKMIDIYQIEEVQYLQIVGFNKHQKIDKRSASKLPHNPTNKIESPQLPPNPNYGMEGKGIGEERAAPVPNGTPPDFKKIIFDEGLKFLSLHTGRESKALRPLVGKWISEHGEAGVSGAIIKAQKDSAIDPISYIERVLRGHKSPQKPAMKHVATL